MDLGQMNLLKQEIEKTFGRKILSSADCHHLCMDISHRTKHRISFNTLRRCFNLMKATHNPSFYTLDVLSNYCGFSSYEEFLNFRTQSFPEEVNQKDSSLLNYMVLVFKNTEVSNNNDITYFSVVQQTINYLDQHRSIVDQFQREISRTRNGQNFYFEQFVNIDKLTSFYGDGLRYYLNEKKTKEAQLFGHSLLCFRYWMTGNDEEVPKHLKIVMSHNIDDTMQPPVCARYFATQLLYADVMGINEESVMIKARQFYYFIAPTKYTYCHYYCFEIVMAEALILAGQFEEALFYVDEIFKKIKNCIPSYIDIALLETIYLFKSLVFAHTGKKAKAKEILENINPNKFYFLSRRYLNILYLSLIKLVKNRNMETEQIRYLVSETGFHRLLSLWERFDPVLAEKQPG
jgi:hypothetical protein